jgi:hypothetical protein
MWRAAPTRGLKRSSTYRNYTHSETRFRALLLTEGGAQSLELSRSYRRRALVESVFSALKRKLSARVLGRSLETQRIQALLLGLAYNLYRLKPCSV